EISERDIKKVPTLRGKTVINLFYETSTRTRTSFEIAAKRLSADTINISAASSSVSKGETLADTARNLEAMRPDAIVVRHPSSGACHLLARHVSCPILNAGDGCHEHPTQALLDLLTIRERHPKIAGLTVAIVGDVLHSRVARSNLHALRTLGATVRLVGPPTLVPRELAAFGAELYHNLADGVRDADVVMMLRIQRERQGGRARARAAAAADRGAGVSRLLVAGGTVVDPVAGRAAAGDVLVDGEQIAATGAPGTLEAGDAAVLDARGLLVLPGLVDMPVHLREPGYAYKETIQTGVAA